MYYVKDAILRSEASSGSYRICDYLSIRKDSEHSTIIAAKYIWCFRIVYITLFDDKIVMKNVYM